MGSCPPATIHRMRQSGEAKLLCKYVELNHDTSYYLSLAYSASGYIMAILVIARVRTRVAMKIAIMTPNTRGGLVCSDASIAAVRMRVVVAGWCACKPEWRRW